MSDRFNPDPNRPYGQCKTCGIELPTEEDSRTHMNESRGDGPRSHTVGITNPGRRTRIRARVDQIVRYALEDALEEADGLVQDGAASFDEISDALTFAPDARDVWENVGARFNA